VDPKTRRDLWILSLPDKKSSPWKHSNGSDSMAVFSPNGRWIAYASSDEGRTEIYIEPRDRSSGGKWTVSKEGGRQPRWRDDGKELFFASAEGDAILSASIEYDPLPQPVDPQKLFDVNMSEISRSQYVVSKDGQRFIVLVQNEENLENLKVITNWRALVQ
jgi:dipeptidyl aminopeptidase/acylaminoacyl peptidase